MLGLRGKPDPVLLVIALDRVAEWLLRGLEGARATPGLHERGSE